VKRLHRHQDELFTFLDHADIEWLNNSAERQQRPAVVARKNSGGNHSDCGAQTQAVLRAIFFTLGLRGQEPVTRVTQMVEEYLENGRVATVKAWFSSNG